MTRARILVMDDDPLFRSLLAATLRKDYLVSVAADGTEGYSKAVEHLPDLAVIDLQMPVCDGLSVLKAFRAHAGLRQVPIIILTGDNSKESVLAAIQLGVSEYVIKSSFSKPDFVAKVARLLANRPKVTHSTPAEPIRHADPHHAPTHAARPIAAAPTSKVAAAPPTVSVPASTVPAAAHAVATAPAVATANSPSDQNLQSILDNWE